MTINILGSNTPRSTYGGNTPRGGGSTTPRPSGSQTPSSRPSASPAYKGRGSGAGNAWAAAAESWAGGAGRRTPRGDDRGQKGYSTTPRHEDPRLTPKYGGRTPQQGHSQQGRSSAGGRGPPSSQSSSRTPQYGRNEAAGSSRDNRTPRGQFGDSTPLYDE